jgi:hypothetical protein
VGVFTCPWCQSTLRPAEGVPIHYLEEIPRLDSEQALAAVRAWAAASNLPVKMEQEADFRIGELRFFPFLRVRRTGPDAVFPLAPLPHPEVYDLGRTPGDLRPLLGATGEAPHGAPPPDDESLRAELKRALGEEGVIDLLVEYRAYFPVAYEYRNAHFSLVVSAGSGWVHATRRPARLDVVGERIMTAAAIAVLFVEAVFLPGLWVKLVAIVLTAAALFPILKVLTARYG